MKKLKSLYALLLCILLTAAMLAGQLLYCAQMTLMAPRHISRLLERSKNQTALLALLYDSMQKTTPYSADLLQRADQEYVKGQLYIVLRDCHQYLISQSNTLPTLYIAPLKPVLQEHVLQTALSLPQAQDNISKVQTVLKALNNKYFNALLNFSLNSQVVSGLLDLTPVRSTGFDRSTLSQIISIYLSFSRHNISMEEASRSIVAQMTKEALQLDEVKDYLDTSSFLQEAFGDNHPLSSFKRLANGTAKTLAYSVPFILIILLLLFLLSGEKSFFWRLKALSLCSGIAASLALLLSPLFILKPLSRRWIMGFTAAEGLKGFLKELMVLLWSDYGWVLVLNGLLLLAISAGCFLLFRRLANKNSSEKKKIFSLPALRLSLLLVLFLLLTGWWSIYTLRTSLTLYQSQQQAFRQTDHTQEILRALGDMAGMKFLQKLQKK